MILDLFIVITLLWGLITGWSAGFVKQLISMVGFIVGLLIAATCYATLGEYLMPFMGVSITATNVIAFLLLWVIVPIFLGFVANRITEILHSNIILSLPNRLLGAGVGILKFALLLSCIFNVADMIGLVSDERRAEVRLYAPITSVLGIIFDNAPNTRPTPQDTPADTTWIHFDRQADSTASDTID